MTDDIKPEVGDLVEYGVSVHGKHGLVAAAPRGIVQNVHKNGSIIVKPERGGVNQKLFPLEFCVLQKAG